MKTTWRELSSKTHRQFEHNPSTTPLEYVLMLIIIVVLMMALCVFNGCSGWTYNGIRGDDLRMATGKDIVAMCAGGATTFAIHTLGHIAAAEAMDKPWHFSGLSEIVDGTMSNDQAAWFGRSGFLAQLAVGYGLKACGIDGYFAKGYTAGTVIEIATYPARHDVYNSGGGDDFAMIERSGDKDLEYVTYTALALGLNFK